MLAGEGPPGDGDEASGGEGEGQLHEGVVIGPVAVAHHRHGQGSVPPEGGDEWDQQIGHPPGVHRSAQDHQVSGAEGPGRLPGLGEGEVVGLQGGAGLPGQPGGDAVHHGPGGVGGAEPGGPHGLYGHEEASFLSCFAVWISIL